MELNIIVDRLDALGLFAQTDSYIGLLTEASQEASSNAAVVYMAGFVAGRIHKEEGAFRIFLDGISTDIDPSDLMSAPLEELEIMLETDGDDFSRGFYDARFLYERMGFVTPVQ